MGETAVKQCTKCAEVKPLDGFYFRKDTEKHETQCRHCRDERSTARAKAHYWKNPEVGRERSRLWRLALRQQVITAYGGACACCGEAELAFLAIDHVNGGGKAHREAVKGAWQAVYRDLVKRNFPAGFRVLCHNCNMAFGFYGACPHQLRGDFDPPGRS